MSWASYFGDAFAASTFQIHWRRTPRFTRSCGGSQRFYFAKLTWDAVKPEYRAVCPSCEEKVILVANPGESAHDCGKVILRGLD